MQCLIVKLVSNYLVRMIFFRMIRLGLIFFKELIVVIIGEFEFFTFFMVIKGRGGNEIGVYIEVIEKRLV